MTSRERVLRAIRHQEPDRLPVFKPNLIQTYEPLEPRVQEFMDNFAFDRLVGPGTVHGGPNARREVEPEIFEDGYGCRFKYEGVGLPYCIHSPLADAASVEQVESFAWPDRSGWSLPDDVRARARELREAGEFVVSVGVGMLFAHEGNPSLHFHAGIGRGDSALVGCPRAGMSVYLVLEVIITELVGVEARREHDPESGASLLKIG